MRADQYVDRYGEVRPAVVFSSDAEADEVADAVALAGFGAGFLTDAGMGERVAQLVRAIEAASDGETEPDDDT